MSQQKDSKIVIDSVLDRMERIESRMEKIEDGMKDVQSDLRNTLERDGTFVTWKTFFWIIGLLVALQTSLFGVIYSRLEKVADTTQKTQSEVSYLNGKLQDAVISK